MRRTNLDSLRSYLHFRVFRLNFASDFFNLLLVRFHQAKIIVVKHLVQGRNNEGWVGDEPSTLRAWPSEKRPSEPLGHAADRHSSDLQLSAIMFLE